MSRKRRPTAKTIAYLRDLQDALDLTEKVIDHGDEGPFTDPNGDVIANPNTGKPLTSRVVRALYFARMWARAGRNLIELLKEGEENLRIERDRTRQLKDHVREQDEFIDRLLIALGNQARELASDAADYRILNVKKDAIERRLRLEWAKHEKEHLPDLPKWVGPRPEFEPADNEQPSGDESRPEQPFNGMRLTFPFIVSYDAAGLVNDTVTKPTEPVV